MTGAAIARVQELIEREYRHHNRDAWMLFREYARPTALCTALSIVVFLCDARAALQQPIAAKDV
jgi:hypothetical protein